MMIHSAANDLKHVNSVTHDGKVVLFATDASGNVFYSVRQDGYEDTALGQGEEIGGWENWGKLSFPNEPDDASVIALERAELAPHPDKADRRLIRSRYRTEGRGLAVMVQLVSALGHIYVFRQCAANVGKDELTPSALLVDRFVLDSMTNVLVPKLQVRFKRSRQRFKPLKPAGNKPGRIGAIDSLDFRDADGAPFREPTTELTCLGALSEGWFSVVFAPRDTQDEGRWHVFYATPGTAEIRAVSLRASKESLFDIKDLPPSKRLDQAIDGIVEERLTLTDAAGDPVIPVCAPVARIYDVQHERQTNDGKTLFREATRIMLSVATERGRGVANLSLAMALDGTLSDISEAATNPKSLRDVRRAIDLPVRGLDEVVPYAGPKEQGTVGILTRVGSRQTRVYSSFSNDLEANDDVAVTGSGSFDGTYQARVIDAETFSITPKWTGAEDAKTPLGRWEKIPPEDAEETRDGQVNYMEPMPDQTLKISAPAHELVNGDTVRISGSRPLNGRHKVLVGKAGEAEREFLIDAAWPGGTATNLRLEAQKRRGLCTDGKDELEIADLTLTSRQQPDWTGQTWSIWVNFDTVEGGATLFEASDGTKLALEEGQLTFNFQGKRGPVLSDPIATGTWVHLACVAAPGNHAGSVSFTLLRNGKVDAEKAYAEMPRKDPMVEVDITLARGFSGKLSAFQVLDRAQSADEVSDGMVAPPDVNPEGLAGIWPLAAIRGDRLMDFSAHQRDAVITKGAPFVCEVTFDRHLQSGVEVSALRNTDLIPVSGNAAYEESIEFLLRDKNGAPIEVKKPFAFQYYGRRSRSSEKEIGPEHFGKVSTRFVKGKPGWQIAKSRFNVPADVRFLRVLDLSQVNGEWATIELRKHRIEMISDSITHVTRDHALSLETIGQADMSAEVKLEGYATAETAFLTALQLKERLEADLAALKDRAGIKQRIKDLTAEKKDLERKKAIWKTEDSLAGKPVTLYRDSSYRSNTWSLKLGTYNLRTVGSNEDSNVKASNRVSSMKVPKGLDVTCYNDIKPTNRKDPYRADKDTDYVGSRWNDEISCVVITTKRGSSDPSFIKAELRKAIDKLATNEGKLARENELLAESTKLSTSLPAKKAELVRAMDELNAKKNSLLDAHNNYRQAAEASERDGKGLTMPPLLDGGSSSGALLAQIQTKGPLTTLATCGGNLVLGAIDPRGRARELVFDACYDTRAPAGDEAVEIEGEVWLPTEHRKCCDMSSGSPGRVAYVEEKIQLRSEWTMEAWFRFPLPNLEFNRLACNDAKGLIDVCYGKLGFHPDWKKTTWKKERTGKPLFKDCGYSLEGLAAGWHHIAARVRETKDSKNKDIHEIVYYIDGEPVGKPLVAPKSRQVNLVGNSDHRDASFGQISELRIWNKALSDKEVAANSRATLTGFEPDLEAYFPLDNISNETVEYRKKSYPLMRDVMGQHIMMLFNGKFDKLSFPMWSMPIGLPKGKTLAHPPVAAEYSTIEVTEKGQSFRKSAMMRGCTVSVTDKGVEVIEDRRIETLALKWVGNAQFDPTLLGYIEGPPPIPSENLTFDENYNGATSVELKMSSDVSYSWNRTRETGAGGDIAGFLGFKSQTGVVLGTSAGALAATASTVEESRDGVDMNISLDDSSQDSSNIGVNSGSALTDRLELRGTREKTAKFAHLGKRFIPKNVGYALVVSGTADVFITKLKRSGRMVGSQVQPNPDIPPDINTITFLINPAYTMSGSLDGQTGSAATSQRFYRHVPEMRSQFGSSYPASYFRVKEAYDLKHQIEQADKNREAYFQNFNSRNAHGNALDKELSNTEFDSSPVSAAGTHDDKLSPAEREKARVDNLQAGAEEKGKDLQKKGEEKRAEIQATIDKYTDQIKVTEGFSAWQKRMEALTVRAGKRNIANTYVWDADGGLRSEVQQFASTIEHTIGGSFSFSGAVGATFQGAYGKVAAEITPMAKWHLTQTLAKTEQRSTGFELQVGLGGVESRDVTNHDDRPLYPGEKVDRYRFMSFYLEGTTKNYMDFFDYVVDPEWLASNDEEARALRQAQGKPNLAWRVLHRVTYVERPALMAMD